MLTIALNLCKFGFSQINQDSFYTRALSSVFSDTIISKGNEYELLHFHIVSEDIKKRILNDRNDSIFIDGFNKFSRLVFIGLRHSFDIPTIPLNNIIYLKDKKIILGLSKIAISPYQVVIYTEDGRLIFKGAIREITLRLNKSELSVLTKKYPSLLSCLLQMPVVKENDAYQLEIPRCLMNVIDPDSLIKMNVIRLSPYFPGMSHPTDQLNYSSDRYYNFFSDSDPLYDLITVGSIPYLLILNSETGEKVNIPLVSNCNILKELQGDNNKK